MNDGSVAKNEFQPVLEAFAEDVLLRSVRPIEVTDLAGGETDQRIAITQRVIEERERVLLGERRQPQRQLGEIDRHLVLVHTVQTALGDHAAGMEQFVLIGGNRRKGIFATPGFEQVLAQLAAGLHQEGAGAHGRVADLEIENLFRCRLGAELLKDRSQGGFDDGLVSERGV